eukprot:COSAG02_NODE_5718_length_4099_cov_2.162250_1_plen_27_part_10
MVMVHVLCDLAGMRPWMRPVGVDWTEN